MASLLSYTELLEIVERGIIKNVQPGQVQGSSIDITLAPDLLLEDVPKFNNVVDLKGGESIETRPYRMTDEYGYQQLPGEFLLASSVEFFDLPLDMSARYELKSTQGRNGNEHLASGWIDPGFVGNLTLELVNCTRFHRHTLKPGMKIGQIVFFRHTPVPEEFSYIRRGQYMNQVGVTGPGGLK